MPTPTGNGRSKKERTLREAEAQIALARERLASNLGALRDELGSLTDWRAWVERRPLPAVALVFALGVWLGLRGRADR